MELKDRKSLKTVQWYLRRISLMIIVYYIKSYFLLYSSELFVDLSIAFIEITRDNTLLCTVSCDWFKLRRKVMIVYTLHLLKLNCETRNRIFGIHLLCNMIDAFHLVIQTSFYLSWYCRCNKDRMIFVLICITKWKALRVSYFSLLRR